MKVMMVVVMVIVYLQASTTSTLTDKCKLLIGQMMMTLDKPKSSSSSLVSLVSKSWPEATGKTSTD